ncbi:MAG: transporter [Gemmiger sp.]|uniref:transporter n=1 Tax=Gemmiger sp. TaxID=2049027 RepID=UPI002E779818|nr:transporter [Gemmiger sp.]MEE0800142.1 transporter [Gemmiger sp.]
MENNSRRLSRAGLRRQEERVKHAFRDQVAEVASLLEVLLAILVLVGLIFCVVPLIQWMPGLMVDGNEVDVRTFLERALDVVIGIEFIKMLAKHSPGSSLEVLLYAIARHMIVGHDSALENLLSVAAIALIFIVRKFFFVPSFGATMPGGKPAPDLEPNQEETCTADD